MEQKRCITVGEVQYLLIPHPDNFLGSKNTDDTALALVYRSTPGQVISQSSLRNFRTTILDQDDVFQSEFLTNVIFYGSKREDLHIDPSTFQELLDWETEKHIFIENASAATVCIWTILKLDRSEAGIDGRAIVPSRCYFKPSKSRPLDGARISVKDNIDIAGHKTTLCNRAWERLYPAKTKHAACVQVLIDAGAIIVGKTKLQAMFMREEPKEAVEFTSPFNPRGDGYQVPSGSSNGSAAGIGSYPWLDFSLGSDTNGSGRKPAQYNGCFSIRPSTGIMDTDGVSGQFPQFDMPVFFGRDLSRFSEFIAVWYGSSTLLRTPSEVQLPVRILYHRDYLPTKNEAQSRLIDTFVNGLETAFGVTRQEVSLAELWKHDCPDGPDHDDIAGYLELAGGYPYYRDSYHYLQDFRNEYKKEYGKPPFVHRAMYWQWGISKNISIEERDTYWRRSEIYRHWLLEKIFQANSKESISIMVFPIEGGEPNYRDGDIPPFSILTGYASLKMSPMMRGPELTTIVGHIPYNSVVTETKEPLPIAASVLGPPGSDLILAAIVERGLKAAGLPTKLKTGRFIY
ncbi:amidase [Penicillium mononematosum]|uniref:amidase n=1 Tax=Penicillium mononematosum TaxID=268346 RepID=UPI0025489B36|nr:amidase [Penicillium mononematosum]KAJ6178047.1 amidase [Penicillium mononematosum]